MISKISKNLLEEMKEENTIYVLKGINIKN